MTTETANTLPESFYGYARTTPDRLAVITSTGSITFGELGARANQIARALQAKGYQPGDRLAHIVQNTVQYWEATLAAGQIGLSMVPVNNTLTPAEMEYIFTDSGAKGVLASAPFAEKLESSGIWLPADRWTYGATIDTWNRWEDLGATESTDPPAERTFGAAMGYTSGTSGRPKGVGRQLSGIKPEDGALGIALLTTLFNFATAPGGVHLCCSPLYHSAPAAFALASLHTGHSVVCLEKFDAKGALGAIERHKVTSTHMVPTHFHRLLGLTEQERAEHDLTSLQTVVHAGAACPPLTKSAMLSWLGPIVWEFYGATEGLVTICSPQDALSHPGSVGRAIPGVSLVVLDADGEEVPTGTEGTIYFRMGDAVFDYHNDPEKTNATRRKGHATVGDIGHVDADGYVYLADRREDVIITGGVNVYPAEVEARLIEHPAVHDVAVVATPDAEWGAIVTAVVQAVRGTDTGPEFAEELRSWCREAIAGPKIPRIVKFTDSLPRTEAGKLSRRKVREGLLQIQPT